MLLENARDDIDRRLIEFGYNPWRVDAFCRLSPTERIRQLSEHARWVSRVVKANAARRD